MKDNICSEVKVLSNLIKRKLTAFPHGCDPMQLTGGHGFILRFLAENKDKDVFQKDVEKQFKIRRSTVTATINRMEKNGLLVRESVDYDSRLKKLTLTEKGNSLHLLFKKRVEDLETQINEALNEEETAQFIKLIKKLEDKAETVELI